MASAPEFVSEAKIADGAPEACRFLLASAHESTDAAPYLIVMHDSAANRLVEASWIPGRGTLVRATPLAGDIGKDITSACIAGDRLVVSDSGDTVHAIDRYAGTVSPLTNIAGPAVMTPDGRTLIAAADRGLLTVGLWAGAKGRPPFAAGIEPFALRALDHPGSMLLLPDDDTNALTLVIGCYGSLEIASFAAGAPRHREPSPVDWRTLPATGLTHDSILLACPPAIVPAPGGPLVYATDDGATGLIAVDVRIGTLTPYPRNGGRYASLRSALACLDSSACLVTEGDAATFLWLPGSDPVPIALPAGRPVAWTRERMLVMDHDRALLSDVAMPPALPRA